MMRALDARVDYGSPIKMIALTSETSRLLCIISAPLLRMADAPADDEIMPDSPPEADLFVELDAAAEMARERPTPQRLPTPPPRTPHPKKPKHKEKKRKHEDTVDHPKKSTASKQLERASSHAVSTLEPHSSVSFPNCALGDPLPGLFLPQIGDIPLPPGSFYCLPTYSWRTCERVSCYFSGCPIAHENERCTWTQYNDEALDGPCPQHPPCPGKVLIEERALLEDWRTITRIDKLYFHYDPMTKLD